MLSESHCIYIYIYTHVKCYYSSSWLFVRCVTRRALISELLAECVFFVTNWSDGKKECKKNKKSLRFRKHPLDVDSITRELRARAYLSTSSATADITIIPHAHLQQPLQNLYNWDSGFYDDDRAYRTSTNHRGGWFHNKES